MFPSSRPKDAAAKVLIDKKVRLEKGGLQMKLLASALLLMCR